MTLQNQQERRALNDGIEDAFINTATYAAGIRTYYMIRRGVIKDLYELFYFNFAVLLELTEGLEELVKDKETIKEVHVWLEGPSNGQSESDIKKRCDTGLEVFTKFKTVMSARGLLALPSKGGR
jgi:predicted nucleotidyltransferase component of viral defense system